MKIPSGTSSSAVDDLIWDGDLTGTASVCAHLVETVCGCAAGWVGLTLDEYYLNTESGRLHFASGADGFSKLHYEVGKECTLIYYYQAQFLVDGGSPVVFTIVVREAGCEIVLYELECVSYLVGICGELEDTDGLSACLPDDLVAARRALDAVIPFVLVASLWLFTAASKSATMPQIFHYRLSDAPRLPRGRYQARNIDYPGSEQAGDRQFFVNIACVQLFYRGYLSEPVKRMILDLGDHGNVVFVQAGAEVSKINLQVLENVAGLLGSHIGCAGGLWSAVFATKNDRELDYEPLPHAREVHAGTRVPACYAPTRPRMRNHCRQREVRRHQPGNLDARRDHCVMRAES